MSIHVTDRCRRYPKFRLHAVTPPSARRGADTVLRYREEGRHRRDTAQRCQWMVRHRSAVSGMGRDTDQRCQRVARHRSAVSDEWSDTAQRCRRRGPTPLSGVGGGVRHRSPSWVVPNLCIAFHDCFSFWCASLRRVAHDDGLRVALLDKITPQPRVVLTSFRVKQ